MLFCLEFKKRSENATKGQIDLVYLVIIQDVCWVLLLLQSPQCVLQLCLKVPNLAGDLSLSRTCLTLRADLLAVNDLMRKSRNKPAGQNKQKYM